MKKSLITCALASALIAVSAAIAAPHMDPAMPGMAPAATITDAQGVGVVKAIDTAKGTITLQHEAIAAIRWPAMTMPFKVASPALLKSVKVGDRVQFTLHSAGAASVLTSIKPV
jgi:Cu(I)/Ag(I) efflux system protein CusF